MNDWVHYEPRWRLTIDSISKFKSSGSYKKCNPLMNVNHYIRKNALQILVLDLNEILKSDEINYSTVPPLDEPELKTVGLRAET